MPYDVFISYASVDRQLAEQLYQRLCGAEFTVWFDKARLEPGFDWFKEVEAGCENSRVFLPLLTSNWRASDWTKYETYGGEVVIPLLVDGLWEEVSTPPIERFQAEAQSFPSHGKDGWNNLFQAIQRRLSEPLPEKAERIADLKHLPCPFFTGRAGDLVSLHEAFHKTPNPTLTRGRVRAITALGGVGKTTLARQYAEKFWRCYPQIFWVDARLGCELEFARLYELLHPDSANTGVAESARAQQALRELNSHAARLLILDNAEDEGSVRDWIPKSGGCHTLITSRFDHWSAAVESLSLAPFEAGHSLQFLKRRTGRTAKGAELQACRWISEQVGHLPLALEQASAYIEQQGTDFSFSDYVDLYSDATEELLAESALGSTQYPDSVITTWKPTLDKLPAGARAILRMAAYLSDTSVPLALLIEGKDPLLQIVPPEGDRDGLKSKPEFWVRREIGFLRDYSMIRVHGKSFSIHPLVQAVERLTTPDSEEAAWVEGATRACLAYGPSRADQANTWEIWDGLIAHVRELHSRAELLCTKDRLELLDQLARYDFGHANYERSLLYEEEAYTLAERAFGADSEEVEERLINFGESLRSRSRLVEAEALFKRSLEWREKEYGHDDKRVANALNYLSLVYRVQNRNEEAERTAREGLAICERCKIEEGSVLVKLLHNLGMVQVEQGQLEKARLSFQRAYDASPEDLQDEGYLTLLCAGGIGYALNKLGRDAEGVAWFERALNGLQGLMGPSHPTTLEQMGVLSIIYVNLGRRADARKLRLNRLAQIRELFGPDSQETLRAQTDLLELGTLEDFGPCERVLSENLQARLAEQGETHPLTVLAAFALTLARSQNDTSNETLVQESGLFVPSREEAVGHAEVAVELNVLAGALRANGQLLEAAHALRQALAIEEVALEECHPKIPHRLSNLALILILQGELSEAVATLERAWRIVEEDHITCMRLLYRRILVAFLTDQSGSPYLEQLRLLLERGEPETRGNIARQADMEDVFVALVPRLQPDQIALLRVIHDAMNDTDKASALNSRQGWPREPAASLSSGWGCAPRRHLHGGPGPSWRESVQCRSSGALHSSPTSVASWFRRPFAIGELQSHSSHGLAAESAYQAPAL